MGKSHFYYGRNILREAIAAKVFIDIIHVEARAAYEFVESLPQLNRAQFKFEEGIPAPLRKEAHQGIAFRTNHEFYSPYSFERLRNFPFIVLCNHIEDVHNLGSIARCAAGFGAKIILHEEIGSASVTPGAVKSSAGCAFKLEFMKVPSIHGVAKTLKKNGFALAGLDISEKATSLYDWKPKFRLALVLGSEKKGIDPELRDECDELIRIPMAPNNRSLNLSNAVAVVTYEVWRQWEFAF